MFEVKMTHEWRDIKFKFDSMFKAAGFMNVALEGLVDSEGEIIFTVKKIKEETEDAETVCGTEEG